MSNEDKKQKNVHIKIDRTQYEVPAGERTGAELRALAEPPIGVERDLWEVIPGKDDLKLSDDTVVEIANGKRFFTTPSHINPGSDTRH